VLLHLCMADSFWKSIPSSRASLRERTLAKLGPQSHSCQSINQSLYSCTTVRGSSRSQSFSGEAADWHELMMPQNIMRPSVDGASAAGRHTTATQSTTRGLYSQITIMGLSAEG